MAARNNLTNDLKEIFTESLFKNDRLPSAIREELTDHLTDHYLELINEGVDEKAALKTVLCSMGSPEDLELEFKNSYVTRSSFYKLFRINLISKRAIAFILILVITGIGGFYKVHSKQLHRQKNKTHTKVYTKNHHLR